MLCFRKECLTITNLQLATEKAKFYAKELWKLDFNIPIEINNRYKNKMGSIQFEDRQCKIPEKIMLAGNLFERGCNELVVDDTLLHELCHWYCTITNKQNSDGSRDFEKELRRIGASTTRSQPRIGTFYVGKCQKCGKTVAAKSSRNILQKYLNNNFYSTLCCHAQIIDGGIEERKDNYKVSDKVAELNRKFKEYISKKSA